MKPVRRPFSSWLKKFATKTGGSSPGEESFWDRKVRLVRAAGGSSRAVAMPPGVMFFENLYLWERAVMEPISGRRDDTPIDWSFRTFAERRVDRVLSISCGTGFWERRIVSQGFAREVDAFDSSQACLEWARDLAAQEGLAGIHYRPADVNTVRLRPMSYDAVLSVAALHHVSNLEHVFSEIDRCLKPGGLLIYDEYVGPNHMQWPDEVLWIVNAVLRMIPPRFRVKVSDGTIKDREEREPVESLLARDPTEAVRSEEILTLTERSFDILSRKFYGGAILMPLFMNIAGNFDASREEDRRILDFCLYLEKLLFNRGTIRPNGVLVVARKRPERRPD